MSGCGCSLNPYQTMSTGNWGQGGSHCGSCNKNPCCCRKKKKKSCGGCGHNKCRCGKYSSSSSSCSSSSSSCSVDCCNKCGRDPCCCRKKKSRCGGCKKSKCCCPKEDCCLPQCIQLKAKPIISAFVVPPTASLGNGEAEFMLDRRNKRLRFYIQVCNLTGAPTTAGLYNAPIGSNGPLIFSLPAPVSCGGGKYLYRGCWDTTNASPLTDAYILLLLQMQVYVSIATAANSLGEVRGQVIPCFKEYEDMCLNRGRGKCRSSCKC